MVCGYPENEVLILLQQKGYKYRIYPNLCQERQISSFCGCCRYVYNRCIDYRKEVYASEHRNASRFECMRKVTGMRNDPETAWLKECDSMALQESVKDLNKAYQGFFEKRSGYPKYHRKHDRSQSYRTRNQENGIRFEGNSIRLPKLGLVKVKKSREFSGRILNATISRTASGKYYVSLCAEEEVIPKANAGGMVGIDVGVKSFFADSNGNTVENPKTLHRYEKKLAREQRRLSRKEKGSHNREKQRVRVAAIHEKIADTRTDFLHKVSSKLVSDNQVIGIEDLHVKGMLRNHKLAKAISDVSWGEFVRMLEYKAFEHGTAVIRVPRFYASSQTCSCCGYKNPEVKDLSVRSWRCPECGAVHDRDHNAAVNILNKALEIAAV